MAKQCETERLADELLVIRCQLGERDAFDDLVARWHPQLWRFVSRMLNNDPSAEDCVQEAWLKIVRAIASLRKPGSMAPWLFSIARRVVMDHLRVTYSDRSEHGVDVEALADDFGTVDSIDQKIVLEDGLMSLRASEREILMLFYLHGMSLKELVDVLEVPVGTIKSRLHRARLSLRNHLAEKGDCNDRP